MERATSLASEIPVRKKPFRKRWDSPLAGYLFISPWLIGFLALTAYPMLLSLYYSFTNYTLMKPIEWVGLDNYERIITADDKFAQSLKLTFYYVLASVPLKLIAALMVALLLKRPCAGYPSIERPFISFLDRGEHRGFPAMEKYFRRGRLLQPSAWILRNSRNGLGHEPGYRIMVSHWLVGMAIRFIDGDFPRRPEADSE